MHREPSKELWTDDRTATMEKFLATKPTLWAFEEQVEKYEQLEQRVDALEAAIPCGATVLDTEKIKQTLFDETRAWKVMATLTNTVV